MSEAVQKTGFALTALLLWVTSVVGIPPTGGAAAATPRAAWAPMPAAVSPDSRISLTVSANPTSLPAGGGTTTLTYTVVNRTDQRAYYRSLVDDRCPNPRAASPSGLETDSVRWYIPPQGTATFTCALSAAVDTTATSTATFETSDGTGVWTDSTATAQVTVRVAADPCVDLWYSSNTEGGVAGSIGRMDLTGTSAMSPRYTISQLTQGAFVSSAAFALDPRDPNYAYFVPYVAATASGYGGLYRVDLTRGTAVQMTGPTTATQTVRLASGPDGTVWSWATNGRLYSLAPGSRQWVEHVVSGAQSADGRITLSGTQIQNMASGDLEVGGAGNLWLMAANGTTTYLLAVAASTAAQSTMSATVVGQMNSPTGGGFYTGIAFGPRGRLYASAGAASSPTRTNTLYDVDMTTGRATQVASAPLAGGGTVADLGSCALPRSRLQVTKRALTDQPAVRSGDLITYQIDTTDLGALAAVGVTLADAVPANTTYVPGSTTLNGVAVPDVAGAMPYSTAREVHGPGTTRAGIIGAGETATVRFTVRVNPNLDAGVTAVENRATVVDLNNPGGLLSDDPTVPGYDDPADPNDGNGLDPTRVPIARPAIRLTKTAAVTDEAGNPVAGSTVTGSGTVTYTYTVDNVGSEPIAGLVLGDSATAGAGATTAGTPIDPYPCASPTFVTSSDVDHDGRLDRGEPWTFRCTTSQTWEGTGSTPVTNTARVTGVAVVSGQSVSATSQATVTLAPRPAALTVTKEPGTSVGPDAETGDIVTSFSVLVHNAGQVPGTYTALTDTPTLPAGMTLVRASWLEVNTRTERSWTAPDATSTSFPIAPMDTVTGDGNIGAGETHRYRVRIVTRWTASAVPELACAAGGGLRNTAAITAETSSVTRGSDAACVDAPRPPQPGITLVKTGTPPAGAVAEGEVTYTLTVTNTSPTLWLRDVTIADPGATPVAAGGCTWPALVPAQVVSCQVRRSLTAAEIAAQTTRNDATVTATPAGFTGPITATDGVTIPLATTAGIRLDKTVTDPGPGGKDTVGDVVTYTFTITNSGQKPLADPRIDDPTLGITDEPCGTGPIPTGGSVSCTRTYALTQADIDRGRLVNVATASAYGLDADGTRDPAPVVDDATATLTAIAGKDGLWLEKSQLGAIVDADSSGDHSVGDTLWYTFLVRNLTDAPVYDLVVTDDKAGSTVVCDRTTLEVGGTTACRLSAPYAMTAQDLRAGEIVNTANAVAAATAGGTRSIASNRPSVTTRLTYTPALTLAKVAAPIIDADTDIPGPSRGDTIDYAFVVTNPTALDIAGLRIEDPRLGAVTCPTTTVPARGSVTCTATYTVTVADVDARVVANTATAYGTATTTGAEADAVTATGSTTTPVIPLPRVELTKTTDAVAPAVGDTVTYTFRVHNAGAGNLDAVVVRDPLLGGAAVACGSGPAHTGPLAPGADAVCTAAYRVTQADADHGHIENTAAVTALSANGTATPVEVTDTDTLSTPTAPVTGSASIVKTVAAAYDLDGDGGASAGDALTYRVTITNTGTGTLVSPTVEDSRIGVSGHVCAAALAPGAQVVCDLPVYTLTAADVAAGGIANTATLGATLTDGEPVSASGSRFTPLVAVSWQPPPTLLPPSATGGSGALSLVKSATLTRDAGVPGAADAGDVVTYRFLVGNDAAPGLTAVRIDDPMLTAAGITPACPGVPAPGATVTCTAAYTVTAADVSAGTPLVNTAMAVGRIAVDGDVSSALSSTSTPVGGAPRITLVKTARLAGDAALDAGDTVTYGFEITNTGPVPVTGVAVADPMIGAVTCPTGTLAPGARITCTARSAHTVTVTEAARGRLTNTATATATGPSGTRATARDSATVGTGAADLALVKTARLVTDTGRRGAADAGDVVEYAFRVTNTGTVDLTGLLVEDPALGDVRCDRTALAAGAATTCRGPRRTVTAADVAAGTDLRNTAVAVADAPTGPVSSDPATAVVPVAPAPRAAVRMNKGYTTAGVAAGQPVYAGDDLRFTFTVVNTGTVGLDALDVVDRRLDVVGVGVSCPDGVLAPGDTTTCRSEPYRVTQADADRGSVLNSAVVVAKPVGLDRPVLLDNVPAPVYAPVREGTRPRRQVRVVTPGPAGPDVIGPDDVRVPVGPVRRGPAPIGGIFGPKGKGEAVGDGPADPRAGAPTVEQLLARREAERVAMARETCGAGCAGTAAAPETPTTAARLDGGLGRIAAGSVALLAAAAGVVAIARRRTTLRR